MIDVFYGSTRVGRIVPIEAGPSFLYSPDWRGSPEAFPISLRMPLDAEGWGPDSVTPWLMNLLPEGNPLRAITRALGVAPEDVLGLIAETGRDLAGALTMDQRRPGGPGRYRQVGSGESLERIMNELPAKPFLVGEEGVSMSLAGAQDKLPVALLDGEIAIPLDGASSTHILKPDNPHLAGSVQNEALCMILAQLCGLDVAEVTTGLAGAREYLLVTRYDRYARDQSVERRHQEDFCQALGRPPAAKYEFNGTGARGPSLADMFALVREHMTAREINRLLDAVIFNICVGNVDSHAKNYSILLEPGRVGLAPLYDLMTGLSWANITQNHAQAIGGQRRGRHIEGRHWRRMAEECGLGGPATLRRVVQVADRILVQLPTARERTADLPAGPGALLNGFAEAITERAELVRNNAARLNDGGGAPDQSD